jgi:hypothetical protein
MTASDDFVKVDLHIHTPASISCYKGKRDDSEFLSILRKAKSKAIKIIALTDHNSIQGYKKLVELRSALVRERNSTSLKTKNEQTNQRIKTIQKDLSLFDDVLVLPGVEFEVRNGIHVLVIFNNTTRTEIIDEFLKNGGYGVESFGKEDPLALSNWDIFALFEETKKYDCLVIDAHTDSTKGILNTTGPGSVRANCFRSPQLHAVCYKNEEQKEKLKSTLQSAKEYSRKVPLSFVKFSDAHDANEIGKTLTWIKVDKLDFQSVKIALANPSEMVSTEEPTTTKILEKLLRLSNSFGIPDLTIDSQVRFKKLICALHNSNGGYILIGVTEDKKQRGIPLGEGREHRSQFEIIYQQIDTCYQEIDGITTPKIISYPLQNNMAIVSVLVGQGTGFTNVKGDGNIYSIKDGRLTTLSATEIHATVEEKVIQQIESKISQKLVAVEQDCHLIKSIFASLPLIRTFEKNSIEARFDVKVASSITLDADSVQKLNKIHAEGNGTSRGNLFFYSDYQRPRLRYAYLRYSLPRFNLCKISERSVDRETIYIIPGGAAYYSVRDYPFYSELGGVMLKLHNTEKNAPYGIQFTLCFLKSSLLLWYCKNKFDDTDLFDPQIFDKLRLPTIHTENPSNAAKLRHLKACFEEILSLERKYLVTVQKSKDRELAVKQTNQHNSAVEPLAYAIDQTIYQLLGLSAEDIGIIENNLRLNNIFLPQST